MAFRIYALPPEPFAELFTMSEQQLAKHKARRVRVDAKPGTPCRVSLADAEVGEDVILVNYRHQSAETPFQASHAIFVREGVEQAQPEVGEVPTALRTRLISLRLFDHQHLMIDADVLNGAHLAQAIHTAFEDVRVSYAHLHYAKPGCFAARVERPHSPAFAK